MKPHDCWNPACIAAQHAGQSCALCLACQLIRDALREEQLSELERRQRLERFKGFS